MAGKMAALPQPGSPGCPLTGTCVGLAVGPNHGPDLYAEGVGATALVPSPRQLALYHVLDQLQGAQSRNR